ncbi:hypothetical protein [Cohnella terricola]|uniref:Uncharacterized protein n=1 Tax=Cohnella terricola TaxID=1289167 RepID=A0A559JDM6_9BACL|nr:hypothetical protein [Cohnella terricola]TVX97970.1 hypothetical protein FPZ45_17140 [Cohnella terricola]
MSATTSNLSLVKPDLSDNIHQTVLHLASNFQKIDDRSDIYVSNLPTNGDWNEGQRVFFTNPKVGGHIGAVNIRSGKAASKWNSLHPYQLGDRVVPNIDNGHWYECIQSGTSAPMEPAWLVAALTTTEDTRNRTNWLPSTVYHIDDIVMPSVPNGRFYVCTVPGTSGTLEPAWETTDGIVTSDHHAVWMTYRIVKWRESGTAVNFRPFGKIE